MKTFTRLYILGVVFLSSLLFSSCEKENPDIDVRNYSFTAKVDIIDNQGTDFEVGQPVKLRISLENIKDRGDSIGISFNVGERKGTIYTEGRPERKFEQKVSFNDEFLNNSVILNYVPKNGGKQTIKFTLTNGKYKIEVSKQIEVNTGTNITFVPLSPLNQILDMSSSTGKITIDNYKDEDNYYNIVYDVIDGYHGSSLTIVTDKGPKNLAPKDTLRLITGKKNKSFTYYYTQSQEGHNTIKLSIIDRYGNEVSRTYELFYAPLVRIRLSIEGNTYPPTGGRLRELGVLAGFNFSLTSSFKDDLQHINPYPSHSEGIKVEFDMSYSNYYSDREETKHIMLKIEKGQSGCLFNFPENGFTAVYKMEDRKIRVSNFKISGLKDTDGRTYNFDGLIKYKEKRLDGDPFSFDGIKEVTTYSEDIKVQ